MPGNSGNKAASYLPAVIINQDRPRATNIIAIFQALTHALSFWLRQFSAQAEI